MVAGSWASDWFSFTYVTNTGAAFGLFPDRGAIFMAIAVVVVVVIAIYYWHMPAGQWLIKLSLGLQLGGAAGNLIDRVQYGHVVDFIDFKFWPVFNLADTSIVIGVSLLGRGVAAGADRRADGSGAGQRCVLRKTTWQVYMSARKRAGPADGCGFYSLPVLRDRIGVL